MSGRMQENSDIAVRLVPEETRAGGMTTPCTMASRSIYTDGTHGVGAGNGVKGGGSLLSRSFLLFTLSTVRYRARRPRCGNQRLESRVRENRQHGSEGGEAKAFPTPISRRLTFRAVPLTFPLDEGTDIHSFANQHVKRQFIVGLGGRA